MNNSSHSSFESGMRKLNLGNDANSYYHHNQQHQPSQQQQYNQPPNHSGGGQWNQGQHIHEQQNHQDTDDEDDDQPLSYQQQSLPCNNFPRPVSIRNLATCLSSTKPSNFVKPAAPQPNSSIVPQDMRVIQSLYENYSQKVYFEGYLYKKNDLTVDGKSYGDPQWSQWYVELCGPALILWETLADENESVMPQYINITDSNVDIIGRTGEPGRENVFSLNSAGANRYLFDVPDYNTLINWVCAIRLSCFECSKLQEIFTLGFLSRSAYSDVLSKPMNKMEGFVQVRFSGTTEWQKYWVVVSDKKEEKKLFGKKSVQSRGQLMFYESKKAKCPVLTMVNVVQTYILYPESPQAIDLVTMFKVEGSTFTVKSGDEQQIATSCNSALIMASSPKELVQWIIGTYDAFKLYGRPTRLNDDPSNINSLNFGEPRGDVPRLFLEVPEVSHIDFTEENLLDNKAQFAGILLGKMQQQSRQHAPPPMHRQSQQAAGLTHQIPAGAPMYNKQLSQGTSANSSQSSFIRSPVPQTTQQQQQKQQRNAPTTIRKVYASDEGSDDDDDEEDDEEEDSDHDSIFNNRNPKLQTKESLSLPTLTTSEDDGFASSILGDIEKKKAPPVALEASIPTDSTPSPPQPFKQNLPLDPASSTSLPINEKTSTNEDEFGLSDSEVEEPSQVPATTAKRPKPKMAKTQVSLSGSDTEEEAADNASYSGSDNDDNVPIHQQYQQQQQQQRLQQQQYMDYNGFQYQQGQPQWDSASMYGGANMMEQHHHYFDEHGYPIVDEDGPIIPQLGDRFATQNSLLDTYRPDRASAHDQEGYARATGQPLIQVPNKPPEPRAGLVGMISQIESEKKQKESSKNRFGELERDRMLERERERYMMEQRSQMMQQPIMSQSMSMIGQPMNYPGMNPAMMQMMGGQVPMMNMMGQPMMYPGMMNMQMMPPMMDPRMSMMMMQQQYGQYPMWQQQQQIFGNGRFSGIQEDDDEDDDVPLGAKEPPIPRNN
ncbi:hypothetical protein [Parasitella parasitica]|uniref:PH domain-containing protein n=1 Tax=Parasitella parasitica TaxID=35722 RepID=A0A0B7MZY4_9FUNG|nr:hypothetical protein [Parasitella parasitica]